MQSAIAGENFMTFRFGLLIATLGALLTATVAQAQPAEDATGVWLTEKGDARVRVSRCGGSLCGAIVSLRDKLDPATGKPAVDDKNPDPALRNRSMIGVQLFFGMKPVGPNKWSGQIYNSDDGRMYDCNVSVAGPAALRVEGCVGAICGGEVWTKSAR
jgi:uncharacterized protein (DUF2147 family)